VDSVSSRLITDQPGWIEGRAPADPHLVIHVGPSVHIACERAGQSHRGISVHGDIDIIPAGVASLWHVREKDTALVLRIPNRLFHAVANVDQPKVELINRFQIRDPRIEHIAWALKSEMDAGYPSGRLYTDSLGTALAACLLQRHSSLAQPVAQNAGGLTGRRLKLALAYIEDNLAEDLSLDAIAGVTGLSVSHCKKASANPPAFPSINM
jgi:AraC family transcriptional regulator